MKNDIKTYRINRFAEVEGNASIGWWVINLVTGIAQETRYPTFPAAKDAANFVRTYYTAVERGL